MTCVLACAGAVRSEDESASRVIYVNQLAVGANDGTSWADAYTDLQDALDDAAISCVESSCQIWVAAGTYKPDRGTGDRFAVFQLFSNLSLYGGFAGWEECPDERDIVSNPSVLEGDLLGNDDLTVVPTSDCCLNSSPGPDHCDNSECIQAVVALDESYSDCAHGWGVECIQAAAIACGELCRPTRSDNAIKLVNIRNAEDIVIDGFTFARVDGFCNQQEEACDRPAALSIEYSSVIVRNCRFIENRSGDVTAALPAVHTALTVEHCVFEDNLPAPITVGWVAGLAYPDPDAPSSFSDCVFRNNGAAGLFVSGPVLVERCRFVANFLGLYLSSTGNGSPFARDCVFLDNFDTGLEIGAPATIANCVLLRNDRGISVYSTSAVIANTVVASGSGTGIYAYGASLTLLNSVVYGNQSRGVVVSSAHIANCIIRGNTHSFFEGERAQVYATAGPPTLRYNSIEGWTGALGGVGNVDVEPMFVDLDGLDDILGTEDDDFHLSPDSPLINFGDPNPPLAPYLDGDGHARILCGRIDMGAYEFGIGDYNCDRIVELDDYAGFSDCLTGPVPPAPYPSACAAYDFATEITEDVDLLDFAGFQNAPFSDGT